MGQEIGQKSAITVLKTILKQIKRLNGYIHKLANPVVGPTEVPVTPGPTYTPTSDAEGIMMIFDSPDQTTVTIDDVYLSGGSFYNKGAGLVTFVYGTAVGTFPDGTILSQDSICSILVITGDYRLKGELI